MQNKKSHPSLTDRRLRLLLKQLREEPAAPQDFRDRVLARLEQEGVLARAAVAPAPGWTQRLQAWLRPAGLGLAAAGALALLLVLRPVAPVRGPAPVLATPRIDAAGAALARPLHAARSQRRSRVLAAAPRRPAPALASLARPAAAAPEHELETAPQVAPSAALAVGDAAAPTPVHQQVVAAAGTVTAMPTQGFDSVSKNPDYTLNSQVWGNVIHASQGEAASIRFSFKTSGPVRIEVFDRLGHSIAVLCDSDLQAGTYIHNEYTWRGTDDQGGMAASGIYLLRIHTPDYTETHKLMLVK